MWGRGWAHLYSWPKQAPHYDGSKAVQIKSVLLAFIEQKGMTGITMTADGQWRISSKEQQITPAVAVESALFVAAGNLNRMSAKLYIPSMMCDWLLTKGCTVLKFLFYFSGKLKDWVFFGAMFVFFQLFVMFFITGWFTVGVFHHFRIF